MAYTPTTWVTGDTVTATKMNKMEQGIADSGSGYDAEVYAYHDNNSSHDWEFTIIRGTFSDLASKIDDNIVPSVLFNIWDDLNFSNRIVALGYLYSFDTISSSPQITFHAMQPYNTNGDSAGLMYINWTAEDVITI